MDTPRIITKALLKKRVLISGKQLKEGMVEELSPSAKNVKIGSVWYENKGGLVLEVLPDLPKSTKPRRSSPIGK